MIESDSLHAGGSIALKGKERQRIFGQEGLKLPDELRLYKFLDKMTGQQLQDLNTKICKLFDQRLVDARLKATEHSRSKSDETLEQS